MNFMNFFRKINSFAKSNKRLNKAIITLSALIFAITNQLIYAQAPLRVEINVDKKDSNYTLLPVSKSGLILIADPLIKKGTNTRNISFSHYATNMNLIWSKSINISNALTKINNYYDSISNCLYLLFTSNNLFDDGKSDFQIVKIDLQNDILFSKLGIIKEGVDISEFVVYNDFCIWGGKTAPAQKPISKGTSCLFSFKNNNFVPKPLFYITNFNTNETKTISFANAAFAGTILSISLNKASQNMDVIMAYKEKKAAEYIFKMYEYSMQGDLINAIDIATESKTNYLETAKIITESKTDKIILGTYSLTKNHNKNPGASYNTQGYYIIRISNNLQVFCKYYSFNEFKNFYNYLSFKNKNKILKKNAKNKSKGSETELNYQLLVHNIFTFNGNYILASEAYYPEYHTEYYTTYYNGYPQTNTYTVFDGYRYTHAIVAAFDKNGTLVWDNTMEIWDILSLTLKNRISFFIDKDNNMVLLYNYKGTLYSKLLNGNVTIDEKDRTPLETNYADDKVKSNFNENIEYWYNNYFIAFGNQEIRNPDHNPTHKTTRNVFYFNKIGFE